MTRLLSVAAHAFKAAPAVMTLAIISTLSGGGALPRTARSRSTTASTSNGGA